MAKRAEAKTANGAAGAQAASKVAAVKAATPWGQATVVQEVRVAQRAGDKRFASLLQLLENERGEAFVRVAYTTDGVVRRGPVTLRAKEIQRLFAAVPPDSALARALGRAEGDA